MKIRAIIAIMIILTSLGLVSSHDAGFHSLRAYPSGAVYSFNFSDMQVGSEPANVSWISFSSVGRVNYSIQRSQEGRGLNVNTGSLSYSSYLESAISVPAGYSILINFSWNDSQDGAYTGDIMSLEGNESITVRFGPMYGFETQVETNGTVVNRSGEMPFNHDSLREFQSFVGGDSEFLQLNEGSSVMRPVYCGNFTISGNVKLFIGGKISNMTVYDISLIRDPMPVSFANNVHLASSSYSIPLMPESGMVGNESIFLPYMNSVVIPYHNGSVYWFNYANRTSFLAVPPPDIPVNFSFVETLRSGNDTYFIFSGITGTVVDIMNASMEVRTIEYNCSLNYSSIIYGVGETLIAISQYEIVAFNGSTSKIIERDPAYLKNLKIISAHNGEDGISALLIGESATVEVTFSSGKLLMQNLSRYSSSFWRGSSVISRTVAGGNVSSIIRFNENGMNFYMYISPSGQYLSGSDNLSWTSGASYMCSSGYLLSENGTVYATAANSAGTITVSAAGIAEFASISNGKVSILHPPGTPSIMGSLNVSFPSEVIVENRTMINYSLTSSSSYTALLSFDGKSFRSNSEYIEVDAAGIPDGNYSANFSARNFQGLSYNQQVTVEVDDYSPGFISSIRNGSYLSNGSIVNYSVKDPWMVSRLTVSYLDKVESIGTSGNFTINSGDWKGNAWVNFTLIDVFGRHYNYSYFVRLIVLTRENFSSTLTSGYVSSSYINISWTKLSWAEYYTVTSEGKGIKTENNSLRLSLMEGSNSILLSAFSISGITVDLANATVIRIGYDPALQVYHSPSGYYSFFGNSNNSSYILTGRTNITSMISVSVFRGGLLLDEYVFSSSFSLTFQRNDKLFSENGRYQIQIVAVSLSGTKSVYITDLYVNNSIPASPQIPEDMYINGSSATIPVPVGEKYIVQLYGSGSSIYNFSSYFGSAVSVSVPEMNATYTMKVTAFSLSGNYNTSQGTLYSYSEKPEIGAEIQVSRLVSSPSENVSYRVYDHVPLEKVDLILNGKIVNTSESAAGMFALIIPSDGNYQIILAAEDLCGNYNTSPAMNISNFYYSRVTGGEIGAVQGLAGWKLSADLSGNVTPEVQVFWYIDNSYAGKGYSLVADIPLGTVKITMIVTSDGRVYSFSRIITNYGYVIPVAMLSAVVSGILGTIALGERDRFKAREAIGRCVGSSVRDARRTAVRDGINRLTWRRELTTMASASIISIEKDMDGKSFIMPGPGKYIKHK